VQHVTTYESIALDPPSRLDHNLVRRRKSLHDMVDRVTTPTSHLHLENNPTCRVTHADPASKRPDYYAHRKTHQTYLDERNDPSFQAESIKRTTNRTRDHVRYRECTIILFTKS